MKCITLTLTLLFSVSLHAAPGSHSGTSRARETSIPFTQYGGIRDWKADQDRGLWIQDNHRRWHYARFMGDRCFGIRYATTIALDTHPVGTFDKFSSILVPYGGRCSFQSVTASDGPPKKSKKKAVVPTVATDTIAQR